SCGEYSFVSKVILKKPLLDVVSYALALMFVCPFNGSQAALYFSAVFQQVGIAEIRTRCNLMGMRRIEHFQSLGEELISGSVVASLMANLGKGNERLSLRLWILTGTSKGKCFLGFLLCLCCITAL